MARPIRIQPPRLSEIELCAWIAQAEPGAILEYHRGFLALDRTAFGRFADTPARAALARSAAAPTTSPSAASCISCSSAMAPRTTAISPSPGRAAKARSPTSHP